LAPSHVLQKDNKHSAANQGIPWKKIAAVLLVLLLTGCAVEYVEADYWVMHSSEDQLHGADGVELFDINGDGNSDALSSWEESAAVSVGKGYGTNRAVF
jgi:hypothetical protein